MGPDVARRRRSPWRTAAAGALAALATCAAGKRTSAADQVLARAYGYSERAIDKGLRSVVPPLGCSDGKDFFSRFRTWEEIEAFMAGRLCALRGEIGSEGSSCEVVSIGTSVEGRPLYAVELRNPAAIRAAGRERAVLMTATLHAREWTSTTSVLLAAVRLDVRDVSALIVPVWNPDGYAHSWSGEASTKKRWEKGAVVSEEVPARMWRKNRRVNADGSVGVDLNRNFGSSPQVWGTDRKSKSINMTESDVFQGEAGWSEPETAAVRDYHAKHRDTIVAFVDVHCCIGAVLEPFTRGGHAPEVVFDVGQRVIEAINRKAPKEEKYQWQGRPPGSASGSGISSSWAFQEAGILFTYVIELRSKFVMPCSDIKPIANELWLGITELFAQLQNYDRLLSEYEGTKMNEVEQQEPGQQGLLTAHGDRSSEARGGLLGRIRRRARGPLYVLVACLLLGAAYVVVRGFPGDAPSSQGKLL
jgi:hypothetical protein